MRNIFKLKSLKITIALVLALALVAVLGLPAMADNKNTPTTVTSEDQINTVKGKVTEIDEESQTFTIEFQNEAGESESITVITDSNTKYYIITDTPATKAEIKAKLKDRIQAKKQNHQVNGPNNQRGLGNKGEQIVVEQNTDNDEEELENTPEAEECLIANTEAPKGWFNKVKSWFNKNPKFGKNAVFGDIAEGDGVVVRVMPNENNLAKQVLIIKSTNIKTVNGEITDVNLDSKTFTVTVTNNDEQTDLQLTWNEKTIFTIHGAASLEIDQNVKVIYTVVTDEDGNETLIAKMVCAWPQTSDDQSTED